KMKKFLVFFIFGIVAFLSVGAKETYAQTFKLELANPSQTISVGSAFQVKVLINTGGQQAINGDALISFDPAKVSIDTAVTGDFFSYFSASPLGGADNKYLASSWEESVAHAKTSSTDTLFATLSLTAKTNGTTSLSFDCTAGNEADSNINKASDSTDILNCSVLAPLNLTIGSGGAAEASPTPGGADSLTPTVTPPSGSVTSTPIPTSTPKPTSTPRPTISVLPRSGVVEVTFTALGIGILLTVMGALSIL
ncbi:hypothetical protein MUP32_02195, partial [Candidatus Microgenomates bacterium]|nr:hypothetical protein [Candidatus Microgenomates bacterium]